MAVFFRKFFTFVRYLENTICTIGLLGTTSLVTFQILNRFWLRLSIKWINDFSLFIFIFFAFFAITLTTREDGHTSVDMFVDFAFEDKPIGKAIYYLFTRILCIITVAFFLLPCYYFALDAYQYPQPGNLVRWFNESWLMESLFITMVLSLLHLIYNVIIGFNKIMEMKKTQTEGEVKP